jgi:hypothetical protein
VAKSHVTEEGPFSRGFLQRWPEVGTGCGQPHADALVRDAFIVSLQDSTSCAVELAALLARLSAALLARLSAAQRELLSLLATKRDLLVRREHQALSLLAEREQQLGDELRSCQAERQRLLAEADAAGLPHDSLANLSATLPGATGNNLRNSVDEARERAQLIRHECLTQWVVVQRTLLHLAQMLEIFATGGRAQPTYGKGLRPERGGALIDQAV